MGEMLPDGSIQGYYKKCDRCGSEVKCNMQGCSSHVCFEYLAVISGGIGPNTWDKEVIVYAKNMGEAVMVIDRDITDSSAAIISIEQID